MWIDEEDYYCDEEVYYCDGNDYETDKLLFGVTGFGTGAGLALLTRRSQGSQVVTTFKSDIVISTNNNVVINKNTFRETKNFSETQKFRKTSKGRRFDIDVQSEIKQMLGKSFTDWGSLLELAETYTLPIDLGEINKWRQFELWKLGKAKGEFETTIQYKERLRLEKYRLEEIEAEFSQLKKQLEEQYLIDRLKIHRDIEKRVSTTEFIKTFNIHLSPYDADREIFTVDIQGQDQEKELFIPLGEAPIFKSKLDQLSVQQILRPTIDGKWVPIYNDIVLLDTRSNEVIPWAGETRTVITEPVSNPPFLGVSINLTEPSGEGLLDADEIAILTVTLENTGRGQAKNTRLSLSQLYGPILYYDVNRNIESIVSNTKVTEPFEIRVPENVKEGKVTFKLTFFEAQGFEPEPITFSAETRAQRAPELALVDFGVVDQSGDGFVTKGETAEITARIQNRGQGEGKDIRVMVIENPLNNIFLAPYSQKEFDLGNIPPGEARDVVFTVLTNNRVKDVVDIVLKIDERRPLFNVTEVIELEIDRPQTQLSPLAFKGKDIELEIADLATLAIDIEKDIPTGKQKNDNAIAVVFGIEQYKNVSNVTYAKRDASFVKEYFQKVLGIPTNRIYYKTDNDVGKAEFEKVFSKGGWLAKNVKKDQTDVYVYYAGHGAPDFESNKAYLIPYDADPNYASIMGYELNRLYDDLADLGANSVTIFLDACFSGVNRDNEIILAGARPVYIEVSSPIAKGNLSVYSAATGNEISSAWPENMHGLFSYFLMKGLKGDADTNSDKQITIKELGDYIRVNVTETAPLLDREQTPQLQTMDEDRVLVKF
ncbi:hypothetical protein ES703_61497 [subsurface metagenome]